MSAVSAGSGFFNTAARQMLRLYSAPSVRSNGPSAPSGRWTTACKSCSPNRTPFRKWARTFTSAAVTPLWRTPFPAWQKSPPAWCARAPASRPSRRIEEDLRGMGADLGTHSGADASSISVSGLAEFSEGLLDLVADLARQANFPDDEFERERRQRFEELRIERTTPGYLRQRAPAQRALRCASLRPVGGAHARAGRRLQSRPARAVLPPVITFRRTRF